MYLAVQMLDLAGSSPSEEVGAVHRPIERREKVRLREAMICPR